MATSDELIDTHKAFQRLIPKVVELENENERLSKESQELRLKPIVNQVGSRRDGSLLYEYAVFEKALREKTLEMMSDQLAKDVFDDYKIMARLKPHVRRMFTRNTFSVIKICLNWDMTYLTRQFGWREGETLLEIACMTLKETFGLGEPGPQGKILICRDRTPRQLVVLVSGFDDATISGVMQNLVQRLKYSTAHTNLPESELAYANYSSIKVLEKMQYVMRSVRKRASTSEYKKYQLLEFMLLSLLDAKIRVGESFGRTYYLTEAGLSEPEITFFLGLIPNQERVFYKEQIRHLTGVPKSLATNQIRLASLGHLIKYWWKDAARLCLAFKNKGKDKDADKSKGKESVPMIIDQYALWDVQTGIFGNK